MSVKKTIAAVLGGALTALAGGGLAILAVRKAWIPIQKYAGEAVGQAFRQLETAEVQPEPAVIAVFAAAIVLAALLLKNRRGLRALCIIVLALGCPVATLVTMTVNGVPMRVVLEIIPGILRSGLF